ncbi:MAG: phage holin family protein [Prevotellaceae bacterium]|nr:phage holin family protein [Prevotellaceae bacterium]
MNFFNMELTEILKRIFPQIVMLAVMYFLVLAVIFLDLWAGVRKAKIRGEFRSSFGFRKTVEKIGKYYNMIFVITVIDVMQMIAISHINPQINVHLPIIPILTFIGSIFVGFIELKSVYEKAEDKEKAEITQTAKIVGKVIADISTQELASKVAEYLKTNQPKEPENENTD